MKSRGNFQSLVNRIAFSNGRPSREQRGVSLVELMVVLVIASIVGIGLTQIFLSTKQAFNTNSALARAQENSRFALGFLNEDLRMVGHLGTRNEQGARPGAAEDPIGNLLFNHMATDTGAPNVARRPASAPWAYRLDIPLQVHEFNGTGMGGTLALPATPAVATGAGEWTPPLDAAMAPIATTAVRGSDVIVMRYLSADFVTLVNTRDRPDGMAVSANIPFDATTGTFFWRTGHTPNFIQVNNVYAFSNAGSVSLFQVTNVGTPAGGEASATALGGINTLDWISTPPLGAQGQQENSSDYGMLLPVHRYELVVYYVALGADGGPSLFRRRLDPSVASGLGEAEELVPGVESMQAVLGVVNNAFPRNADQPTAYMTGDAVSAGGWGPDAEARWRSVVSARIGVLMRSQQDGSNEETGLTRNVAGTNITPNAADRRMRFVYETQVSFRNRNRG